MSLLTIPVEVLVIIIQKLDTKSIYNLQETCLYLNHVICSGVVKECHFSLNTLATPKSLKSVFFKSLAPHLKIMNLSGVPTLTKTALISALKKLKILKDLDVSYTKIIMSDCLDIVQVRPTLKNLTINYLCSEDIHQINDGYVEGLQKAFEQLENVCFVGSISMLLCSLLPLTILNKADISCLKLIINTNNYVYVSSGHEGDNFEPPKISHFLIDSATDAINIPLLELPIISAFDLQKYEILIFQKYVKTLVHATPLLKEFILKHYDIEVHSPDIMLLIMGEAPVMLWHRETTNFDDKFYSKLLMTLKHHLVYNFDTSNLIPVKTKHSWYSVNQSSPGRDRNDPNEGINFKKRRLAQPNFELNYSEVFKEKESIKLKIMFKSPLIRPVTIVKGDYLQKLSHLCLIGSVQFSPEFFRVLFECSETLVTLQILHLKGTFAVPSLLQSLPKSKCLKNILIHVSAIQFSPLFVSFSQCKTLENIYLCDPHVGHTLPNPKDLFTKLDNLYNLCVQAEMAGRDKKLWYYKKIRTDLGKDSLNIDFLPYTEALGFRYSPYFRVFEYCKQR